MISSKKRPGGVSYGEVGLLRRFLCVGGATLASIFGLTDPVRSASGEAPPEGSTQPDVVFVTLDTTRADALGSYGADDAGTATLDRLASSGLRWERAITASPLTLPAHATLMTGLEPPLHGVRDNGLVALGVGPPTLAEAFAAAGYRTGAVIASAVLDRRFGLDRGFEHYDDVLTAERVGEYGYPERDADQVTAAALDWAGGLRDGERYFLWVHYYDPHAPYQTRLGGAATERQRYAAEVAHVDRALGRLLDGLPGDPERRLVAVVADHGEMLGEHGERAHGILLYRSALEVPMILSGPGIVAGTRSETVATRDLAATVAEVAGVSFRGRSLLLETPRTGEAIYSETFLPSTAYGWSPMLAITEGRWRYVEAPQPELFDFVADPGEETNLVNREPERAETLRSRLADFAPESQPEPGEVARDLAAELRALGYLSGMSGGAEGAGEDDRQPIDPKEGIHWLAEFEGAKRELASGRAHQAAALLDGLVRRSPDNVPFLMRSAEAQFAAGRPDRAFERLDRALEINPALDLLHSTRGDWLRISRRCDEAEAPYRKALELNPRLAAAALGLAECFAVAGRTADERQLLEEAHAAGVGSAIIATRLGQLALAADQLEAADRYLAEAVERLPTFAAAWHAWGRLAAVQGDEEAAEERRSRAATLASRDR